MDDVVQRFIADTSEYVAAVDRATAAAREFARAALEAAAASHAGLGGDSAGLASLVSNMDRVEVHTHQAALALEDIYGQLHAGISVTGAAAAAANAAGGAFGFLNTRVALFGGAATIGALHLLVDGIIEVAATVVPAAIAFGAFAVVAVPTVQDLYQKFQALHTVVTATGQAIPPLTGGFSAMADAAKPQVYQLLGDALLIAGHSAGGFATLAHDAGTVVDQLAARFTVAITNGSGFSSFLRSGAADLAKWGDVIGNLGGALGNLFRAMPGYAGVLLNVIDGFSRLLEWATAATVPLLKVGLALHGVFLYGGLAATGMAFLATRGLSLVAQGSLTAGTFLERFGTAGRAAGSAMGSFAASAEGAAGLPWGWIAVAAAGVGILAYELIRSTSAAQDFVNGLQGAVNAAPSITAAMTAVGVAQTDIAQKIITAQQAVRSATAATNETWISSGRDIQRVNIPLEQAHNNLMDLTDGQRQFNAEAQQSNQRLASLAGQYGGTASALGLLNAAGITVQQWQDRSAATWAQIQAQVAATVIAYKDAGQAAGVLGADEYVLSAQVNSQYTAMQKLNGAWDTFLGLATGLEGAEASAITAMRQLTTDAKATGASFTGVNAASITLQDDFINNLFPSVQKVIDSMSQAHAKTRDLAAVLATDLKPAVDAGALANDGLRTAIFDMAKRAGYTGPNQIGPLTAFINTNATSLQNAANLASAYAGALGNIPSSVTTNVYTNFINTGTPPAGIYPTPTGQPPGTTRVGNAAVFAPALRAAGPVVNMTVNVPAGAGGTTADPRLLQMLQSAVQETVLRYTVLNPGSTGLARVTPGVRY